MTKNKIYKRIVVSLAILFMIGNISAKTLANANDAETMRMEKIAGYFTGVTNKDGGAAEIIKYNKDNNKFYVINGVNSNISVVSLDGIATGKYDLEAEKVIDVKSFVENNGFKYGDITSIAINNVRKEIAIAVQQEAYNKNGKIVVVDYDGNFKEAYDCGVQPDMVTYTPDSKYLLSANEGEPRHGYGPTVEDPEGTVTIVDLDNNISKLVSFDKFNDKQSELIANKVLINKGSKPSEDFEPEYITVDSKSKTAYVSLQEANAVATIDIISGEVTSVKGLGLKDHSLERNSLDVLKDGKIDIKTQENLYGVYMPDGISIYEKDGQSYIVTANEGDGREYVKEDFPNIVDDNEYTNMKSIKIDDKKIDALDPKKIDGLDEDKNYILGGRSFTIWNANTMEQVYDSGSDFEKITASKYPDCFNSSNSNTTLDNRSGKKGPEPEEVRIGKVGEKTYAFVGLERIGGIMAYDITDPSKATYANYLNTRDFSEDIKGDVAPEGIDFITAENSETGTPLLLVANEVSGTVSVLQINEEKQDEDNNNGDNGDNGDNSTDGDNGSNGDNNGDITVKPETPANPTVKPDKDNSSKGETTTTGKLPQTGETGAGVMLTIGTLLTLIGAVIFKNKK